MADLVFLDPRRRPRPLLRSLVGGVLRRHRQGQGRTLADVARAARVSMPYLSEVERGRKEASSEVLAAVCAALRIDLSDLLAEVWHDLAEPAHRSDLRRSEARPGDTRSGDARFDDARSGDARLGDTRSGDATGEPAGDQVAGQVRAWRRRVAEPVPGHRPADGSTGRGRGVARPAHGTADVVLLAA